MTEQSLEDRVVALETLATGQAAMVALLSALLVKARVLTVEEAMLVATSGVDAQQFEGLTAAHVGDWTKGLLESIGRKVE